MIMTYDDATKKYESMSYGRDHGRFGQTYEAAQSFCAAIEGYHVISRLPLKMACFPKDRGPSPSMDTRRAVATP